MKKQKKLLPRRLQKSGTCPFCSSDLVNAFVFSGGVRIGEYFLTPHTPKSVYISNSDREGQEFSIGELERRIDALWREEF